MPPGTWMFVVSVVLSGTGLCVGLITGPEGCVPSVVYPVSVIVKPREGRPDPESGRSSTRKKKDVITNIVRLGNT
jgi:hypothetical protein